MVTLVPAILTKDADEVAEKVAFLEAIPEITDVQIDFEDGKFVPNDTVLPGDLHLPAGRLRIEAHMMVTHPQNYLHELEELGVNSVIMHYESFHRDLDLMAAAGNARALGFKVGIAINPETEVAVFDQFMDKIDLALVMSVNPGFQGQKFLPGTFSRLAALREKYEHAILEVDGGINLSNFQEVVAHGASRIAVGSGIWQTRDPKNTIKDFLAKLR